MLKKRLAVIILSLLLILMPLSGCAPTSSQSQSYEKTIATARTEIWKEVIGRGASSATVAIMDNGKIVYEEGFAMAEDPEFLENFMVYLANSTLKDDPGLGWDMVDVATFAEQGVEVIGKNGATFQFTSRLHFLRRGWQLYTLSSEG